MELTGLLGWLIENSPAGVLILEKDGRVLHCSRAAEKFLGLCASLILGCPWSGILKEKAFPLSTWPEPLDLPRQILWPYVAGDLDLLVHGISCDGRTVYLIYPTHATEPNPAYTIAREQSAATTIHEIRNPLTVIQGFVQLLESKLPPQEKSGFNFILSELDRVNRMLEDLLSFHVPPAGTPSCDVATLLIRIISLYLPSTEAKGIRLGVESLPHLPLANISSGHFLQIVHNLLQNSVQAMTGEGIVKVTSWNSPGEICVEIQDNGNGIPPEVAGRIFEPFFTTKDKGTGLGLAICQRLAADAGGSLLLTRTGPEGTTFTLRLPASL